MAQPSCAVFVQAESAARVQEMEERLQEHRRCREAELVEHHENKMKLVEERIANASEARKNCSLWAERQVRPH